MSRLDRIKRTVVVGLQEDDYDWLVRQTERAEELQDTIDNKIVPEIEKGMKQNKRYREAIEMALFTIKAMPRTSGKTKLYENLSKALNN